MDTASLNEFSSLINQQMQFQEMLREYLSKAEALSEIALCREFLAHERSIIHDYLWILNDMICQIKTINEDSQKYLLKQRRQEIIK